MGIKEIVFAVIVVIIVFIALIISMGKGNT